MNATSYDNSFNSETNKQEFHIDSDLLSEAYAQLIFFALINVKAENDK